MKESESQLRLETGSLLISEPFMIDEHFRRTVILIVDYLKSDGSVGFVLNKEMDFTIEELIDEIDEFPLKVHYGGPVAPETLHFLHCKGDIIDDSILVGPGIYWGGNFDQIKFLIRTKVLGPYDIQFFLGYSGWSPGQLEEELELKSWFLAEADSNYIFSQKMRDIWKTALEHKGDHFSIIGQMSTDSILN